LYAGSDDGNSLVDERCKLKVELSIYTFPG
jgi:hypothetical protein